jgi:hypothetical protein
MLPEDRGAGQRRDLCQVRSGELVEDRCMPGTNRATLHEETVPGVGVSLESNDLVRAEKKAPFLLGVSNLAMTSFAFASLLAKRHCY